MKHAECDLIGPELIYKPVTHDTYAKLPEGVGRITTRELKSKNDNTHEYYCLHCPDGPERKERWRDGSLVWNFAQCVALKVSNLPRHLKT